MSNFKFNTTVDITEHARVMVSDRTDMDTACSFLLSDTGFTDEQNPTLRVLSGGTFKTIHNRTQSTVSVPSTYLATNALADQYDGKKDWPVAVLPIRDGAVNTWHEARSNVIQFDMAPGAICKLAWNGDAVSCYIGTDLVFTCNNNPQVMLDLQAPGGNGGKGGESVFHWPSPSDPSYSGGGGGGGGFATILFSKACGGVQVQQDSSSGNFIVKTGSSYTNSVGTIYKGGNGSGKTPGSGGTVSLTSSTGVYIINKIAGGAGGNGYGADNWSTNESFPGEVNAIAGDGGDSCEAQYLSISPRIVSDSAYKKVPGTGGAQVRTTHAIAYNFYPGGGGGGSALGTGGTGQRSIESGPAATAGTYGAGGGGGGAADNCTSTPANGGAGRVIMYLINQ